MCYLKLLKLVTFQTHHGELLIWNFQMRLEKEVLFKIFETCNFSNPSWGVAYLKLSDETWNEMCYLKLLKLVTFQTHHGELLIWNFQMRLEKEVLFEIFETCNFSNPSWGVAYLKLSDETWNEMCYLKLLKLETFQTFKPIPGVGYLKHSDKTWYEMCYLKFWNILTFSNSSWELLIWNFQMRLQTRYSIWNVWNLKLLKHVMGVAYLKLSDETWQRGAIWNFSNLKLFNPIMGSCLFETFRGAIWNFSNKIFFQMRLEMLKLFKLLKHVMGVAYLKLSDETWNEMCYLKFWNLKLLKHVMGVAYLKLSDETWNEMCYMKLLKLETFQTCHGSCLFETFRWDLKWDVLFEIFETWNFSNMSWELLIWNFQMRLEMRCAIWNFWNLKLFKPIMGVAYLKLSDETWKRGAI